MRSISVLLMLLIPVGVLAQQPEGARFDVVSIKKNATGSPSSSLRPDPNGITGVNVNALRLVRVAYQVPNFQIVDVPSWFESERYDITARAERPVSIADLQGLVRSLLADHFGLRVKYEPREINGYELQLDRPGGSRLQVSAQACSVARPDQPRATAAGGLAPCFRAIAGEVTARGVTTFMTAQELSGLLNQPVVDRTGLDGVYDYELRWRPDDAPGAPAADVEAPSLFTAVREQLGLRLVSGKPKVDVYVIAAAHRPDAN